MLGASFQVPPGVQMPAVANFALPPTQMDTQQRELPDPEAIAIQKDAYAKDLEEQLRKGVETLGDTHRRQTDDLHSRANQEKTRYNLAMDQQVKQQELLLSR